MSFNPEILFGQIWMIWCKQMKMWTIPFHSLGQVRTQFSMSKDEKGDKIHSKLVRVVKYHNLFHRLVITNQHVKNQIDL